MQSSRRPVAAVVGDGTPPEALYEAAEALGRGLVDAGFRVGTGGLGGVMEAAARGARASARWTEGTTLGLLPTLRAEDANPYIDIAIPTGLHHARNVLLVAMADVVIAVGGGAGTLSEIALAWQHGKPIIGLDLGEGWSARLAGTQIDLRRQDRVHAARSVEEAVSLAVGLCGSK